jgi:hypothetical protein
METRKANKNINETKLIFERQTKLIKLSQTEKNKKTYINKIRNKAYIDTNATEKQG